MHESCGLFGIYAPKKEVAQITYFGLHSLQHRGQESSGMAVSDGKKIKIHKQMGLVTQVFNSQIIKSLKGYISIGHNRYGTCGSSSLINSQPIMLTTNLGTLVLAHNGNLINVKNLKKSLYLKKESFTTTSDSEIIAKLIAKADGRSWEKKIINGLTELKGAYSLLILSKNQLFAVRDPWGIRPLALGKYNGGYVFASESSSFGNIGAIFKKELKPGEIMVVDKKGSRTILKNQASKTAFCIFEYIYFSRPDTILNNQLVYQTRLNAGRLLARQSPVKADYAIAIPDSGTSAAIGFSQESGIPFIEGLLKSRYIGRTFIQPEKKIRKLGVRLKFSPVGGLLRNKDIVVIDDSIVRGTTMKGLVGILRKAGAKKIHLRIASPPLVSPCYLGVDIERYSELIAYKHTLKQITEAIKADSLSYLSLKNLKKAIGRVNCGFCLGCFTGKYPLEINK
jgi:amidophosphoribosyltransferase